MITAPSNRTTPDYSLPRIKWSEADYATFGRQTQLFSHEYNQLPLFETSELIALLDNYPRKSLQAFTMGSNPTARNEWKSVDIAKESTGEDMWNAVEKGNRFWGSFCNAVVGRTTFSAIKRQG